jgi:hypothetical protein
VTGEERLKRVQDRLVERGVRDVKVFLAPGARELDKTANDLAKLLESYLEGRTKVVTCTCCHCATKRRERQAAAARNETWLRAVCAPRPRKPGLLERIRGWFAKR